MPTISLTRSYRYSNRLSCAPASARMDANGSLKTAPGKMPARKWPRSTAKPYRQADRQTRLSLLGEFNDRYRNAHATEHAIQRQGFGLIGGSRRRTAKGAAA